MPITAPYNFVPLNKEVFYPEWSEQVSHDIPFEDGESGEIEITITAKSPIFIRDHANPEQFCQHNGQYYIPSTSVKGMVRNVLEIMSFSKLQLQDKTLSYRDLNNPSYEAKAMDANKIYMGWLKKDGAKWKIENLGKVTNGQTRIKYEEMKNYLEEEQVDNIKKPRATATDKYKAVGSQIKEIDKGYIIFTGSTGNKTREFLFPKTKAIATYEFDEKDKLIATFKEAYYIGTPNESKDWKSFLGKKFRDGQKIPIFFQLDDDENIKHFGLSMLYKLPYEYSLQKILEKYQNCKKDLDLAQTMFGVADDSNALKGRLYFSHCKIDGKAVKYKRVRLPLSTPRPTFYPNYIVQCDENGKTSKYITYDNSNAILRGFKMYPPRKTMITSNPMCEKNTKICTSFNPLDSGTKFVGKIRFHNLKEAEIGALLSVLTFFGENTNGKFFHKIGMAKAYGFGTVSIDVANIKTNSDASKQSYIDKFISCINNELKIDILRHPRIEAFLKLSSYSFEDKELLHLGTPKEFIKSKQNKEVLPEVVRNGYDKSKICKQPPNQTNQKQPLQHQQNQPKTAQGLADTWGNR